MAKTYEQEMYCENCGNEFVKEIEKGRRVSGYYECPKCGCSDARAVK